MRSVVLGLGVSGRSAVEYLKKRGDEVIGLENDAPFVFEKEDFVVKSPGIPLTHPWVIQARRLGCEIVGEVDLGLEELRRRGKKVLGITGTNGKTTTTLMTTALLEAEKIKALAVGNIGRPLLEAASEDAEVFVVEVSSFQLATMRALPFFDAAVCLNITANHLDWHGSFAEYKAAKLRIRECLKPGAPFFLPEHLEQFRERVEKIIKDSGSHFQLFTHDKLNLAAALALTNVSEETLKLGMQQFKRPPHRLELVGEKGGVQFINDSKATSVDAVIKAVEAIEGPMFLLAGGVDKGGDFRDWALASKGKVKQIFAFGGASHRISRELEGLLNVRIVESLEKAVAEAISAAEKGDVVLLSPGCSSYDQFQDYQHRGETFKQIVGDLL